MSCIKSLPERCRLGIARVGIRTLLLVLFTYVTQHTAVLLGNSSTLNKRGENPPRCNRTTPAVFSLANPSVNAQTIFSFSAVMAFHEALTTHRCCSAARSSPPGWSHPLGRHTPGQIRQYAVYCFSSGSPFLSATTRYTRTEAASGMYFAALAICSAV